MNLRLDSITQRISEASAVLLIALLSRIIIFASSAVGFALFNPVAMHNFIFPNNFLDIFTQWDGQWYQNIALHGYPVINHLPSGNWAFFPLYPFLMSIGGTFLFDTTKMPLNTAVTITGFIISNALFFVCALVFYKLSKLLINNKKTVLLSVVFFCFWGSSFFYSAVYSESLFMALALLAFYFLEKEQTKKSTLFGFFAGFARSTGFIVSIPFIYNGLQTRKYRRAIFQSLAIFLPYILFNIYGYFASGIFPIREVAQKSYWSPTINQPVNSTSVLENISPIVFFTFVATVVSIPLIYYLFKEKISMRDFLFGLNKRADLKYWALTLVSIVMLVFVVLYAQASSIQRYATIILPMYWVAAILSNKNPKIGITLLFLWTAILIAGTVIFASGKSFIL